MMLLQIKVHDLLFDPIFVDDFVEPLKKKVDTLVTA